MFMWKRASPVKRPDLKADESFKLFVNATRGVPKDEAGAPDEAAPSRPSRTFVRRDDPNVIDVEVVERNESANRTQPAAQAASADSVADEPVVARADRAVESDVEDAREPSAATVQGAGLTARRVRTAAPADAASKTVAPDAPVKAAPAAAPSGTKPARAWGGLSGLLGRKKSREADPELAKVLEAMQALSENETGDSDDAPGTAGSPVPAPAPSAEPAQGWASRFRKAASPPAASVSPAPAEPEEPPAKPRFAMPGFKRKPAAPAQAAAPTSATPETESPSATATEPAAPVRAPRAGLNAFMGPRSRVGAAPAPGSTTAPEANATASESARPGGWFGKLGAKRPAKASRDSELPPRASAAADAATPARTAWLPVAALVVVALGAGGFAAQQRQAHQQAQGERTRLQAELTRALEAKRALLASSVTAYARLQSADLGLASERAALMWAPRRFVTVQLNAARQQFDVRLAPGTASRLAGDSPELAALLAQQALALRELPTPPGCTRSQSETNGDPYAVQVRFVCEAADGPGRSAGRG